MPDSIRLFRQGDPGFPVYLNPGDLIPMLDMCLVNGVGARVVQSLTVTNGVGLVQLDAHGLSPLSGDLGPVVRIAGATPAQINGDWRSEILSPDQVLIDLSTITVADGQASGTITMAMAPAGWEKVHSGVDDAIYRSTNAFASGVYFQFGLISGRDRMRASRDLDALINDTTDAPWISVVNGDGTDCGVNIVCDDRTAYLTNQNSTQNGQGLSGWGDFQPADPNDPDPYYVHYRSALYNTDYLKPYNSDWGQGFVIESRILNDYSQLVADYVGDSLPGGSSCPDYPNAFSGELNTGRIALYDGYPRDPVASDRATDLRGLLRGALAPIHDATGMPADVTLADGRRATMLLIEVYTVSGGVVFPLEGTW